MSNVKERVQSRLFELKDVQYKEFHCKLMPNVNPDTVIGVRTPELRKFAKVFSKTTDAIDFLSILPHEYYEENNLHGFLIETIQDYHGAILAVETFLPYINNWATCDLISPKVFQKHLPDFLEKIKVWLNSDLTYTVRFAIGMLMRYYLNDAFQPEILELVVNVKSREYYVNMMIAWFFATALAKQYNATVPLIQEQRLDRWTHNKAIQKAIESNRISDERKAYLRALKVK
jgi:3-methyladenine DNA glycosylase AlkD